MSEPLRRPSPPTLAEEVAERERIRRRFPALSAPLPDERAILSRWDPSEPPLVTVVCTTFDHGHLIADALHGFLMQRTTFPFRILVRDDASTDGAQEVLLDHQRRYPTLIRLELAERNTYADRRAGNAPPYDIPSTEFTALCEGDDIWTDPEKLQLQIEDLRLHPDIAMSVAGCLQVDLVAREERAIGVVDAPVQYRGRLGQYHHTSTFVLRSAAHARVREEVLAPGRSRGDFALLTAMARVGGITVMPRTVSIYWSNGRGVWSSLSQFEQLRWHYRNHRRVLLALGRPWPVRELLRNARKEAKLFRPALEAGDRRAAAVRAPLAAAVGLPPLVRRSAVRLRRAPAALGRRWTRWWTRGDSNP